MSVNSNCVPQSYLQQNFSNPCLVLTYVIFKVTVIWSGKKKTSDSIQQYPLLAQTSWYFIAKLSAILGVTLDHCVSSVRYCGWTIISPLAFIRIHV